MSRALWFVLILAVIGPAAFADDLPKVPSGHIERLANFPSRFVAPRNVDVWLPPGYGPDKRYAVIYMHDGQMLFDPAKTWNKRSWDAATTVSHLMADGQMAGAIVVGIWVDGPVRHAEYYPEKFLASVPEPHRSQFTAKALGGKPRSDDYLRFIVTELKPYIDAHFATLPEREHTAIMGSSMGGLISLYAICEYPDVFGAAGALSTHWIATFEANAEFPLAAFIYLRDHLPAPGAHRLYMDRGTAGLDALYAPAQPFVDQLVRDRGYTDQDFQTLVYEGANHVEDDWAKRFAAPLKFLLRP